MSLGFSFLTKLWGFNKIIDVKRLESIKRKLQDVAGSGLCTPALGGVLFILYSNLLPSVRGMGGRPRHCSGC